MIPHIPHEEFLLLEDPHMDFFPSEGVNSEDISMSSNNSSEMNLDNNDEADSVNELRNLIAQQTVVQMQEHSFKNLKEEFAF